MAITWGPWVQHYRMGIDILVHGTTATIIVYGQNEHNYAHAWNSTLVLERSWSGSKPVRIEVWNGSPIVELYRATQSFTGRREFGAVMRSGLWDNGQQIWAYKDVTIHAPAPARPTPPQFNAVSYSGSNAVLSWTNRGTYDAVIVERSNDSGGWSQVGRPSGQSTSFTDTTVPPNKQFFYRIASVNAGGVSDYQQSSPVYSIPAAPAWATADRIGNDIEVDAPAPNSWVTGYDIRNSSNTTIASNVQLPYLHKNVSVLQQHSYQVRARVASNHGTQYSDWSPRSNTVSLLTVPDAPTLLTPTGGVVELGNIGFQWQHTSKDTSQQQNYELQYRRAGTSGWSTLSGSTVQTRTVSLSAGSWEWRVRTKGAHASWSEYSRVAVFETINKPTADIQIASPYASATAIVGWAYGQPQGKPQQAWVVELLAADGTKLESAQGTGNVTSHTFATRLGNNLNYSVVLRVQSEGLWSVERRRTFRTQFPVPALPTVVADWSEALGGVNITVTGSSSSPAAVRNVVERSIDGGETWKQIADLPRTGTLADVEALSFGENKYRVSSFTADGGVSVRVVDCYATSPALWLSGGDGFNARARLLYEPGLTVESGRDRALLRFAGRELPVTYSSRSRGRVLEVICEIADNDPGNSSRAELEQVVNNLAPVHLYRDPDGNHVYCMVSNVKISRGRHRGWWSCRFTVTQVDYR